VIHLISVRKTAVIAVVDAFIGPKFVMMETLALLIAVLLKHLNVSSHLLYVMIIMPALLKNAMKILDTVHILPYHVMIMMLVLMIAVIQHLGVNMLEFTVMITMLAQ
jgi:hypothetical protein